MLTNLLFLVVTALLACIAWLGYLATESSTMALALGLLLGILGRLPFDMAFAAAKASGDRPEPLAEPEPEPVARGYTVRGGPDWFLLQADDQPEATPQMTAKRGELTG